MRRVKLLVLVGAFALAAAGCNDTPKPTDKDKPGAPTKAPADNKAKPAEGSGSN
ncbi:unnamed protein product [Gemmataceae bacterium]|nr:unnamed protein product [Gemmataceae bacterium]VTT99564.1 unnamed protein product [Gemmataceae bacterium]